MNEKIEDNNLNILEEIRYNKKTAGKPLSVTMGQEQVGKKQKGASLIGKVMVALGYYDKARMESPNDPFERMVKNAKQRVGDGGIIL